MRSHKKTLMLAILALALASPAFAQQPSSGGAPKRSGDKTEKNAAKSEAGKGGKEQSAGGKPKLSGPIPVLAANAELSTVPIKITAIGIVVPAATVVVKALVSGQLMEAHFKEGQDVKKGDPLFTIDKRPYEAALRKAEAALARDTVDARNAAVESKRYEDLIKKNVVAKEEYDRSRTTAETKAAQVQLDQAEVENAKLQLGYCSIYAPIDGRTGSLAVDVGNLVKNDTGGLVTIHQTSPINVGFSIPERDLPALKASMDRGAPLPVEASIPGSDKAPRPGVLAFLDNEVDRNTGTVRLKAEFENKSRLLWPQLFVNITLYLGAESNRVVVPSEAVQTGQKGTYVAVIQEDGSFQIRLVKIGRIEGGRTVVETNLKAGEKVITDGHLRLAPGAKVAVKKTLEDVQEAPPAPTGK